jgi:hypothetical protein
MPSFYQLLDNVISKLSPAAQNAVDYIPYAKGLTPGRTHEMAIFRDNAFPEAVEQLMGKSLPVPFRGYSPADIAALAQLRDTRGLVLTNSPNVSDTFPEMSRKGMFGWNQYVGFDFNNWSYPTAQGMFTAQIPGPRAPAGGHIALKLPVAIDPQFNLSNTASNVYNRVSPTDNAAISLLHEMMHANQLKYDTARQLVKLRPSLEKPGDALFLLAQSKIDSMASGGFSGLYSREEALAEILSQVLAGNSIYTYGRMAPTVSTHDFISSMDSRKNPRFMLFNSANTPVKGLSSLRSMIKPDMIQTYAKNHLSYRPDNDRVNLFNALLRGLNRTLDI